MIEFTLRGPPILVNLDKGFKINRFIKEFLQRLSSLCGNFLQCYTLMANNNAFLLVTFNIDDRIDMNILIRLLETFDAHLDTIGYLLVVVEQDFLANNL